MRSVIPTIHPSTVLSFACYRRRRFNDFLGRASRCDVATGFGWVGVGWVLVSEFLGALLVGEVEVVDASGDVEFSLSCFSSGWDADGPFHFGGMASGALVMPGMRRKLWPFRMEES